MFQAQKIFDILHIREMIGDFERNYKSFISEYSEISYNVQVDMS